MGPDRRAGECKRMFPHKLLYRFWKSSWISNYNQRLITTVPELASNLICFRLPHPVFSRSGTVKTSHPLSRHPHNHFHIFLFIFALSLPRLELSKYIFFKFWFTLLLEHRSLAIYRRRNLSKLIDQSKVCLYLLLEQFQQDSSESILDNSFFDEMAW